MSADVAEAFADAQEAALRACEPLKLAMGLDTARIYAGVVPQGALLPHILIGEDQALDDDTEADDCKLGGEIFATVHIWSKPTPPDNREARRIARQVQTVLNAPLALAGHQVDIHELVDKRFQTDPDQSTHAILVFRYETSPL